MVLLPGWLLRQKFSQPSLSERPKSFLCYLIVTQDVREKATRMFRAETKKIIANKSTVDGDSPTYLVCFDSDFCCMGIDTLCTQTHSGNKSHRRVRDCRWRYIWILNWGRQWSNWYHQNPSQFLCAWSEVASFVSPTLSRDIQGQSSNQVWYKNWGRWGWVHFVVVTKIKTKTSSSRPTCQHAHLPNCSRCHTISFFWDDFHGMWCISSLTPHLGRCKPTLKRYWAKEDINWLTDESKVSEGVSCNNKAVKTSNLSNTRQQGNWQYDKQQVEQINPLTFSPTRHLTMKT